MSAELPSAEEVRGEMTREGWSMNVTVVEAVLAAFYRLLARRQILERKPEEP